MTVQNPYLTIQVFFPGLFKIYLTQSLTVFYSYNKDIENNRSDI